VVSSDLAHIAELADDDAPRRARDAHESETRAAIAEVQEIATGLYGPRVLATLRLAGALPSDPRKLALFAGAAADAIAALKPADLPAPRIEGAKVSMKAWAETLRTPSAKLTAALGDVAREEAEAVGTLAAKNAALTAFDTFTPRAADVLEALLRLAGMDHEADRLHRSVAAPASASTSASTTETPAGTPVTTAK
jgi:hypothetical protein